MKLNIKVHWKRRSRVHCTRQLLMIMMNLFRGSNVSNMSSIVGAILNQKGCPKHQNTNKPCGSAVPLATGQHGHQNVCMQHVRPESSMLLSNFLCQKRTWGQMEDKRSCLCQKSCLCLFDSLGRSNGWSNCPTNPISSANLSCNPHAEPCARWKPDSEVKTS